MERAKIGEVELEYSTHGTGEPVLLIHGAHIADAMQPLVTEPALAPFQTILYHRRGYAGSARPLGPTSTEDQARDAFGLLDHLSIPRAHVVGHSYGGMIALAFAAAAPTRLRTLALLEPPPGRARLGGLPAGDNATCRTLPARRRRRRRP